MTRGKQYRAGWEHPDTARRRAVWGRRFKELVLLASAASQVYAAFGSKLHI